MPNRGEPAHITLPCIGYLSTSMYVPKTSLHAHLYLYLTPQSAVCRQSGVKRRVGRRESLLDRQCITSLGNPMGVDRGGGGRGPVWRLMSCTMEPRHIETRRNETRAYLQYMNVRRDIDHGVHVDRTTRLAEGWHIPNNLPTNQPATHTRSLTYIA